MPKRRSLSMSLMIVLMSLARCYPSIKPWGCVPGDRVVAGMIDGDDNEAACGEIGAEPRHLHCAGSGAVRQRNDWIFAEYWSEHGIFGGATGIE